MTDGELKMVRGEIRDAMRRASKITRDECANYVRQFGGRVLNEHLAQMIGRIALVGDFNQNGADDDA